MTAAVITPEQAERLYQKAASDPAAAQVIAQEVARLRSIQQWPAPGDLAFALDPINNIQVPWLRKADEPVMNAIHTPGAREAISAPSQEGKSTKCAVWGAVTALRQNPDTRIIIFTHSEELALTHSERIRQIIRTYGTGARDPQTGTPMPDRLGIGLGDKQAAGRWTVAGHRGGVVAMGVGSAAPGVPCDLMILDDLHASMTAADSKAEQKKICLWWDTVASQRLAPRASVLAIGTRWSINDIFGYLFKQEPGVWRRWNFPAIAQTGILDSLNREPGTPLESAREGRDWEQLRSIKPVRVWAATYQGHPVPTSGGMFAPDWFNQYRHDVDVLPPLHRKIVAIDPADSGVGDLTGIVAMGLTDHGNVLLTHDASALLTSDQWAKKAVDLAIETGAGEIVFEAFNVAATYSRILKTAAIAAGVPRMRITPWKQPGSAAARATGLSNAIETGKARVWQHRLADLETDACTWLGEGQHCPDRVAAAVAGFEHIAPKTTNRSTLPDRSKFERRVM